MTKPPASESENTSDSSVSEQYRNCLHRTVDAVRISLIKGQGRSNEEIEAEYAARRKPAAG
jgi:hypothetical protein